MKRTRKLSIPTASAAQTARLGEILGERIDSGLCISLTGPLGAGKTVLTGGLCRGLGIDEKILSPTFVLYEEFEGRLPVVHLDLYRLEHEVEIEELGVFDIVGGEKVVLMEWGDRSDSLLAASDVVISIVHVSPDERSIRIEYTPETGPLFENIQQ